MRSYGQYCPMAMALEVLGERWTLLIVRDLLGEGCRFNDLARGLPGISRTLLAQRLRQLERDRIVERREAGGGATLYALTRAGQELLPVVEALVTWGARWAFGSPDPCHLDPVLLLWWMRGGVRYDRLPPRRVVVQFDFRGRPADSMWLVLEPTDASVCLTPPGFEVDLVVTADLAALFRVWGGHLGLAAARRAGLVWLEGPTALVRAFPTWWTWSPTAPYVRAATRATAARAAST
jgi:DNA-binding HxlR family transcriptional regulator